MPTRSEILDKLFDGYSDYPPHEEVNKIIDAENIAFMEWYRNSEYLYKMNLGNVLTDTKKLHEKFTEHQQSLKNT